MHTGSGCSSAARAHARCRQLQSLAAAAAAAAAAAHQAVLEIVDERPVQEHVGEQRDGVDVQHSLLQRGAGLGHQLRLHAAGRVAAPISPLLRILHLLAAPDAQAAPEALLHGLLAPGAMPALVGSLISAEQ